jgi:hypothetical protein
VLVYGSFSLEEVEVVVSSGVRVADRRQRWLRRDHVAPRDLSSFRPVD